MSTIETRSKKTQPKGREPTSEESSSSEQYSGTEQSASAESSNSTERTVTRSERPASIPKEDTSKEKSESQALQSKRAEIRARMELLRRKKEQADAAAELAQTQLEMLQLEETSVQKEEIEKIDLINEWIDKTPIQTTQESEVTRGVNIISDLLSKAIKKSNLEEATPKKAPTYMSELCTFDGDPINWIPFISHYTDTSSYFSHVENIARIRKSLRGHAREAVKSLLYTCSSPDVILRELKRRFGQPAYIVKGEIAELDKLPRMPEDVKGIGAFASAVFNTVNTIKQLNRVEYLYSTDIADRIVVKMNQMIRFKWQEFKATRLNEPVLNLLSEFLTTIADQFDEPSLRLKQKIKTENNKSYPLRKRVNVTNEAHEESDSEYDSEFEEEMRIVLAASTSEEEKCLLCERTHNISKCNRFTEQSIKERWETVKKLKMCFRCLKTNHRHLTCKAKPCNKEGCTRKHHELLHQERPKPEPNKIVSVNHIGMTKSYLKIVPVELLGPQGKETVMALLDEGSTVTLLVDKVAEHIGATGPQRNLVIEGISGHQMTQDSKTIKIKIKGLYSREYQDLKAHTIEQLNLRPQAITKEDLEDCPHLSDIADQLMYESRPPALLIGQDNWHLIVTRELKAGNPNRPVASLTRLGWILHGCQTETPKPVQFINHARESKTEDIDELIKNHFSLDSLGISKRKPTNDPEERAITILQKTTRKLPEGRFECGMLWRTDNETMPINRNNALRRLEGIERKFKKNQEFKLKYSDQIRNLLNNGYAELATNEPSSPRTWYLPHFAVVHPQKGKLRVVFDAAERTNGKSLNDALLSGPDLLQSLFGVLIRFRQGTVAVAADIKEMFLRIIIREEDRDSLRFLWRENETDTDPKEYRMKSLIFGATSSPCTAIFVKNHNAQDFKEKYPEAVSAIERCHYMDDYLQSFATAEEANKISHEVDLIHKSGGFELRGWTSNNPSAIKELGTEHPDHINLGDHDIYGKTLGMTWHVNNDAFRFALNLRNTPEEVLEEQRPPTKREVASAVMSVFDPLGLATPVLIQGKTLIQQLWRTGINWDDHIPETLLGHWSNWLHSLECLQDLSIPRCTNSQEEGELHTFVDASENAYAAATYWRTIKNDRVEVKLIAAKAKVAPLKPTSIPRLELQAALLGCRLAANVEKEMDITAKSKYYWSDSRTVLAWIKSDPRTFKTFVAHRLAEIEELTKTSEWRYVPTKHNVADDATKAPPRNFNNNHRWFHGPEFLTRNPNEWPKDHSERPPPATGEEKAQPVAVTHDTETQTPMPDVKRFSSWTRYLRATARFLQSVDCFKNLIKKPENVAATKRIVKDKTWKPFNKTRKLVTQPEQTPETNIKPMPLQRQFIKRAEKIITMKIQNDSFKTEIQNLRENKPLNKSSRLRRLTVVMLNNVMHLETRLTAAKDIAISYKKPIVLDGRHDITRLIVHHYHKEYNHGNHNTIMNELRQKYYITALRSTVKLIARKCQWCKVHKAIPMTTPLGDLPAERLQQRKHPFTCTAVDYFGPITIVIGRRTEKRWIALYTCLTTRAIHLEIAASLSADSMILTLKRMIARRGAPEVIYSDNGTNFVGANKELQAEFEKIAEKFEEKGITWKFIPPGAPHMGGSWERLVRSVKTALNSTINTRHLREDVLHTLLLEAEHLINSRPLTEVSLDPDDQEGLTPNHFLIGRSSGSHRLGDFDDSELIGPPTWKTVQRLADHFWKRWLVEYLPSITPRYNTNHKDFVNPSVGDIVIIIDNSLPRGTWPKGEIIQTYPGPDGKIRIVDVRTTAGTLKRPVSRLIKIDQSSTCNMVLQITSSSHEGETVEDCR